jgi:hypothetical protein
MKRWIKESLIWAIWMTFFMTLVFPFFSREDIQPLKILIYFPIACIVGLLTGYFFKRKRSDKTAKQ